MYIYTYVYMYIYIEHRVYMYIYIEHRELPVKLLDDFLRNNKSNIN